MFRLTPQRPVSGSIITPVNALPFWQGGAPSFGDNVNRGLLKAKLAAGSVGLLFVGDSITVNSPGQNISQSCIKRWPIPTCGAAAGMLANGDTGWPISIFPPANNATVEQIAGPSGGGLRPGDAFLDGTTGHNLLRTVPIRFLAEYANFGTTYAANFYANNCYNPNWDENQTIRIRLVYRANSQAPTDHRIVGRGRHPTAQTDAGNLQFNAQINAGQILTQTSDFARGSGAQSGSAWQGRSWNATELLNWRCDYRAASFELQTRPAGSIFWFYAGEGGYTSRSHHAAGDVLNIGGFGAYTTYYSDDALQKHLQAFNLNTFFIYLGQNQSSNENPGGDVPGNYKANIEAIIARYKAACAAVGISNPTFILVSIYPTTDNNTRTTNMAAALREIALADSSVEFIDLRKYVVNTFGNYSTWNATYLRDGIHPNTSFSNIIADYLWSQL